MLREVVKGNSSVCDQQIRKPLLFGNLHEILNNQKRGFAVVLKCNANVCNLQTRQFSL